MIGHSLDYYGDNGMLNQHEGKVKKTSPFNIFTVDHRLISHELSKPRTKALFFVMLTNPTFARDLVVPYTYTLR